MGAQRGSCIRGLLRRLWVPSHRWVSRISSSMMAHFTSSLILSIFCAACSRSAQRTPWAGSYCLRLSRSLARRFRSRCNLWQRMQRECGFAASTWGAGASRPTPCPTGFRTGSSRFRLRLGFNRGAGPIEARFRSKGQAQIEAMCAVRHPCGQGVTFGKTMDFAVPRERSPRCVAHGLSIFSWENGTPVGRASVHVLHIERTRPAFVQMRVRTLACMDGRAPFAPPARLPVSRGLRQPTPPLPAAVRRMRGVCGAHEGVARTS